MCAIEKFDSGHRLTDFPLFTSCRLLSSRMIEARSWHDNAIIVRRLVEDDTGTPRLQARASKIWIRGGCLSSYGLTWRQSPMIAVKEYNRTACEPHRSRDLHLHRRRSLPSVTSAYRARGTHNFILIDRMPIHRFYALVADVDLTTCRAGKSGES